MTSTAGRLICYCFGYGRQDIAADLAEKGSSDIPDRIRSHIQAGDCDCQNLNPSGRCCLGAIQKALKELEQPTDSIDSKG